MNTMIVSVEIITMKMCMEIIFWSLELVLDSSFHRYYGREQIISSAAISHIKKLMK